jgi:hypothetical protein
VEWCPAIELITERDFTVEAVVLVVHLEKVLTERIIMKKGNQTYGLDITYTHLTEAGKRAACYRRRKEAGGVDKRSTDG